MTLRRPVWFWFIPQTTDARIRAVSVAAPTLLFGITTAAILAKQSYYRASLAEEDAATWDRVDRRAYVALPNGRMAQVHPRVDTDLTVGGMISSVKETLSLLP